MPVSSLLKPTPVEQARKKAKHLRSSLKHHAPEIKLGECLNIISKLDGERDWNAYAAKLKKIVPEEEQRQTLDGYINNTFLPLIVAAAKRRQLEVTAETDKIETTEYPWEAINKKQKSYNRRLKLHVSPRIKHGEGVSCSLTLDVTSDSVCLRSANHYLSLDFYFPEEAIPALTRFLMSEKVCADDEPKLTRVGHGRHYPEPAFQFRANKHWIEDSTLDETIAVIKDPVVVRCFKKDIDRFFKCYSRAAKAYDALYGRWSNGRLLTRFEDALWKLNSDEPPYMSNQEMFYSVTIGALDLHGALHYRGPDIVGKDWRGRAKSSPLGACQIISLEEPVDDKPAGYYVAKYGDVWQAHLYLKGFTEADVDQLSAEFGIPQGFTFEDEFAFYQTPAFDALCSWAVENAKFVKRVGKDGGRYLTDWHERVTMRNRGLIAKPKEQDLLNALEREPLLFEHGIHCLYHVDLKKTTQENNDIFRNDRANFARSGFQPFSLCCEWLRGCDKRKTINPDFNSRELQQMVKAWANRSGQRSSYVSNGAFIAAAIHMGFDWKVEPDEPSVKLNISGKSPAIVAVK
ncbi:MAG: glyoxalase superfamily protein [Desulfuromonadales bacterium]|nr:glyoxalase superfamily protein [Desulfuromonadales bacterium]